MSLSLTYALSTSMTGIKSAIQACCHAMIYFSKLLQFVLGCSAMPELISAADVHEQTIDDKKMLTIKTKCTLILFATQHNSQMFNNI